MKNAVKLFAVLAVIAVLASSSMADDKAEKKAKGKRKKDQAGGAILKQLEKADLSDGQEKQIKEIVASYSEKLAAANKQLGTARKSIAAARKQAVADGKKGKELKEAVNAGLTDDQKAAMAEVRELSTALRQEVAKVLTDDQKETAGFRAGRVKKEKKKKTE